MKCVLRLFELGIPSIESLNLADEDRLRGIWSELRRLRTVSGVQFFGRTDTLKPITGVDVIASELRKAQPESYSFADVKRLAKDDPRVHWSVGIRNVLITVTLAIDFPLDQVRVLTDELVALDGLFMAVVGEHQVDGPVSNLDVLGVAVEVSRPPRAFGIFSDRSLVDVIHLEGRFDEAQQRSVQGLRASDLVEGAERHIDGDLLIVRWGDPSRRAVEEILSDRYAWFAEHGDLPIDSSFNELGDKEFALFGARPTRELTAYSEFSRKGMKGVVFDSPEEVRDLLAGLALMLESGTTSEGYPIEEVILVAPTRDAALSLGPLAREHRMSVAYAGPDDRLWDPFPAEYVRVPP